MIYQTPGGVTYSFDDATARDAFLASQAGQGVTDVTNTPVAQIEQQREALGQSWNAPGGGGYQNAMSLGMNDPSSNPNAPTSFGGIGGYSDKQSWIRDVTGYQGEFGNGGFNQYAAANGYDPATMTRAWNGEISNPYGANKGQFQPYQPQGQFQPYQPQSSWGGLLGGTFGNMGGLLGGWGNGFSGGSMSSAGPRMANTSSNMLWSR